MQTTTNSPAEHKTNNPLLILHQEVNDRNLKKSALESVTTISIALGRKRTREQLIPYLGSIFTEETVEIQKIILRGLAQLLHPVYIGKSHHSRIILELVMDILCVFSNKQIRDEAYICLEKVFSIIDVRKAQNILVEALKSLNCESEDQNIRQLVLKMIPFVYAGVDGDKQKQLIQILNTFKHKLSDQKLLSQVLTSFIKVMPPAPQPQIRNIIAILVGTGDKTIFSNLIEPIILLTRVSGEESTIQYLKPILQENDPSVVCASIRKYLQLAEVFKTENLAPILDKIQNYDSQPQQIKNTILDVLDSLPLNQQNMIKLCEPPTSLQLKTTLSETLCRVSDTKALLKLFNSADPNFQLKLFPKLPPISESHIEVVDKVLNSKSWRQKLTIMQNIQMRTQKQQNTQILLTKLIQFLGDKIACVRFAVADGIKNIIIKKKININKVAQLLSKSLTSKSWFERQAAYKIFVDLLKKSELFGGEKQQFVKIYEMGSKQKVANIKMLAEQMRSILQKIDN